MVHTCSLGHTTQGSCFLHKLTRIGDYHLHIHHLLCSHLHHHHYFFFIFPFARFNMLTLPGTIVIFLSVSVMFFIFNSDLTIIFLKFELFLALRFLLLQIVEAYPFNDFSIFISYFTICKQKYFIVINLSITGLLTDSDKCCNKTCKTNNSDFRKGEYKR